MMISISKHKLLACLFIYAVAITPAWSAEKPIVIEHSIGAIDEQTHSISLSQPNEVSSTPDAISAHTESGTNAYKKKDYATAEREFRQALTLIENERYGGLFLCLAIRNLAAVLKAEKKDTESTALFARSEKMAKDAEITGDYFKDEINDLTDDTRTRDLAETLRLGALMAKQGKTGPIKTYRKLSGEEKIRGLVLTGMRYKRQGLYDQAEPILTQALAEARNLKDAKTIFIAMNALAGVYRYQNRSQQAIDLYKEALDVVATTEGKESAAYATVLDNLAQVCFLTEPDKAAQMQKESIAIYEKTLGADSPDLAQTYDNLANSLMRNQRLDEAVEYHKKAINIYEKTLKEDARLATALDNLGTAYSRKGDVASAEEHQRRALKMYEKTLGENNPDTAIAMSNLASTLEKQQKFDEALKLHEKEYQVWKKLYGESSRQALEAKDSVNRVSKAGNFHAVPIEPAPAE